MLAGRKLRRLLGHRARPLNAPANEIARLLTIAQATQLMGLVSYIGTLVRIEYIERVRWPFV